MAIAIGDIHGCLTPLRALVEARIPRDAPLVFLGDYIDRGEDSASVVAYLIRLSQERECHFLRGNHEDMLLDASRGQAQADLWLHNGGEATLRSYGCQKNAWIRSTDRLAFARSHRAFYKNLPLWWEDARAIYVHAGIDPYLPDMQSQRKKTLLWVREHFHRHASAWKGKPIVFGHTPTHTISASKRLPIGTVYQGKGIVGIDTACVYGGALTALDTRNGKIYQEQNPSAYLR